MRLPGRHISAVLASLALAFAGCASDEPVAAQNTPEPTPPPPVLTLASSVAPVADLVAQVGGDRVEVSALIPPGADSHTYEPRPSDVVRLTSADGFIGVGLGLNDASVQLAEANLPEGAPIVLLGELVAEDLIVRDHDHHHHDGDQDHHHDELGPNPHVWMSVRNVQAMVPHVVSVLTDLDPDGAAGYERNAAGYDAELERLDAAIAAAVATIPEANRRLVTYHDAWSYFARDYDLEFVAAVQPADFSQPSAREMRTIIDQIRELGVPAVFGSEVFPSDVLDAIAEETEAVYVGDLRDDELPGEPGDPEHSYAGMMLLNARLIVEGLGGDPTLLPGPRR